MKYVLNAFVMICARGFFAAPAFAEKLSTDNVSKFVKALPDVEIFSEGLHKEGKDKELNVALQPKLGEKSYAPYLMGIEIMKEKLPSDYAKLGDIVKKHDFKSQEEWANTGDGVMLAYMAIKIDQENPNALKQLRDIPEATKAKMPEAQKAQLNQSIRMMEIFTSAPKEDREAVKPHMNEISAWLERSKSKENKEAPAEPAKKPAQ